MILALILIGFVIATLATARCCFLLYTFGTRNQMTQDKLDDPRFTLAQWRQLIEDLIKEHGEDTTMYTDGGYSNVTLKLEKPK